MKAKRIVFKVGTSSLTNTDGSLSRAKVKEITRQLVLLHEVGHELNLSVHAMRTTMVSFPIIGYQMVIANFFQSIGKAKISVFLSLSRQLVFLIPLLLVLPTLYGVDGVWWSMQK